MKKTFWMLAFLMATLSLTACKGEKPKPVAEPVNEETAAAAPAPAEPEYNLEAIAKAIEGCTYVENFKNGVAAFRKNGVMQYVDKLGRIVDPIPEEEEPWVDYSKDERLTKYKSHGRYSEGMCWVYSSKDQGIGYVNEAGELVIPCQYEWAVDHYPSDFHEGVCPVMTIPDREIFSYIDKTGDLAFPGFYNTESPFSEGLAFVREFYMDGDNVTGTQPGYIDHTGKMVIFLDQNNGGGPFHDGVAKVYDYMEHCAWFIDRTGQVLFDLDPDRFYYYEDVAFSEGLCAIRDKNDHWAIYDKTGRSTDDFVGKD